jgi:hypothetical protein
MQVPNSFSQSSLCWTTPAAGLAGEDSSLSFRIGIARLRNYFYVLIRSGAIIVLSSLDYNFTPKLMVIHVFWKEYSSMLPVEYQVRLFIGLEQIDG